MSEEKEELDFPTGSNQHTFNVLHDLGVIAIESEIADVMRAVDKDREHIYKEDLRKAFEAGYDAGRSPVFKDTLEDFESWYSEFTKEKEK